MGCICKVNGVRVYSCSQCLSECCGCCICDCCTAGCGGSSKGLSSSMTHAPMFIPTFGTQAHINAFHTMAPYEDLTSPTFWGVISMTPYQLTTFNKLKNAKAVEYYETFISTDPKLESKKQSDTLLFKAFKITQQDRDNASIGPAIHKSQEVPDFAFTVFPPQNSSAVSYTDFRTEATYYTPTPPVGEKDKKFSKQLVGVYPLHKTLYNFQRTIRSIPMTNFDFTLTNKQFLMAQSSSALIVPLIVLIIDFADPHSIDVSIAKFLDDYQDLSEKGLFIPLHFARVLIISMNEEQAVQNEFTPANVKDIIAARTPIKSTYIVTYKVDTGVNPFTSEQTSPLAKYMQGVFCQLPFVNDFDNKYQDWLNTWWYRRCAASMQNPDPCNPHVAHLDRAWNHPYYNAPHIGYLLPTLKVHFDPKNIFKVPHKNIGYKTVMPFELSGKETKLWLYDPVGKKPAGELLNKAVELSQVLTHAFPEINGTPTTPPPDYNNFKPENVVYRSPNDPSKLNVTIQTPHPIAKNEMVYYTTTIATEKTIDPRSFFCPYIDFTYLHIFPWVWTPDFAFEPKFHIFPMKDARYNQIFNPTQVESPMNIFLVILNYEELCTHLNTPADVGSCPTHVGKYLQPLIKSIVASLSGHLITYASLNQNIKFSIVHPKNLDAMLVNRFNTAASFHVDMLHKHQSKESTRLPATEAITLDAIYTPALPTETPYVEPDLTVSQPQTD